MLNLQIETRVQCPYCWEQFSLLVDASTDTQEYVEDCEICCRPIDFVIDIDEQDQIQVQARMQHE